MSKENFAAMSCNQMMRVQFCCRRWTGGEAEYELVKNVPLERELDELEVERMVDEEGMRVGDEISLIRSLFGFTDLLLEMRKLMTMTRSMMRAMPVMQPEMM